MKRNIYELLLNLVKDSLTKKSLRKPIDPEIGLALTLSYLSQGTSHQFLAWSFKLGKTTMRNIVLETCKVLWDILSPIYVTEPTKENYKQIANDFCKLWELPNCVGASLKNNLLRPYPGNLLSKKKKFFNYRLWRARRVIENSFGVLVSRWRVLRNRLECFPENAEKIVFATIALHNFIMLHDQASYCPPMFVDWEDENKTMHEGEWKTHIRNETTCLTPFRSQFRNAPVSAFQLRENLGTYFMNDSAIPSQERAINNLHLKCV